MARCPACLRYEFMRLGIYPQPDANGVLTALLCQSCGYDSSKGRTTATGKEASYTAHRRGPLKWQWPPPYEPEQDMIVNKDTNAYTEAYSLLDF